MSLNNQIKIENTMPSIVTALPTGADRYLGREVYYKPSGAANSPVWHCVWDTALNGGSGAWAVMGGPLYAEVMTSQTTTSATYVDLATVGPSVTIPAAGIYDIRWELHLYCVTGLWATASLNAPGTTNNADYVAQNDGPDNRSHSGGGVFTLTGSGTAKLMYRVETAGNTGTFLRRRLWVTPIELRP
jgi:hypothetical protein